MDMPENGKQPDSTYPEVLKQQHGYASVSKEPFPPGCIREDEAFKYKTPRQILLRSLFFLRINLIRYTDLNISSAGAEQILFRHDRLDHVVGLGHADTAEASDVVDAFFDVVVQDAVAALQPAAFG